MAKEKFGATASHSPNPDFEYPVVEKRMETLGGYAREAKNLPQAVAEMFKNFGRIILHEYDVFDLLIGEDGKYPFVSFTMEDGMNGWLLLPNGYCDTYFIDQEIETTNSVFTQLHEGKTVVLSGEISIQNQIFKALGDQVSKITLNDGSEAFYLNSTN